MGTRALPLFVLTGGEPLRQDVTLFVQELLKLCPNAIIQIETAGSFYREIIADSRVQVVVSPKTAHVHPVVARLAVAFKYVIRATDELHPDYGTPIVAWNGKNDRPVALSTPPEHLQRSSIILQPCDEGDAAKNFANMRKCYEISMRHGYRIGLQMHKILDLP
jgi:organic radical activating enzyme